MRLNGEVFAKGTIAVLLPMLAFTAESVENLDVDNPKAKAKFFALLLVTGLGALRAYLDQSWGRRNNNKATSGSAAT
jgi:hypothetical protein